MKIFVLCPNTSKRIYLPLVVEKRSQIELNFKIKCPYDDEEHFYQQKDVNVEPTYGVAVAGTLIGGVAGAVVGGPIGAILGGLLGILTGNGAEKQERDRVNKFLEDDSNEREEEIS